MKTRILSLLLVMAMMLSIVPMVGATDVTTEPKFTGYNLYLQNSIAICFEANRAAIEEGFEKVEFYIDEQLIQTRATLPEADENGKVSFRCTKLTPAQLGETVTAKLYIGGEIKHEFSTSVKDYCLAILNNEQNVEAWNDAELRTMLVDLLNYGAATQAFAGATTPLVNADLGEYAALATTGNLILTDACSVFEYTDVTAPTVSWYGVGLNLKDSITLRYEFVPESVEGLAIHFFNDGYTLDAWVTNFEKVENTENHYYAYFGMLNPTQLSETVSAVAYTDYTTTNHVRQSHKLLYSAESYAYAVANGSGFSAELKALTDAMMRYGNAARSWNCDHAEYKNGVCQECEKEKVFAMTTDTITIQAEDAILAKNEVFTIENEQATGVLVNTYKTLTSYNTLTAKEEPGSIVVKFIPKYSGTYTVQAKVYRTSGATGALVAAENDTTTKYSRAQVLDGTNTFGTDHLLDNCESFEFEAGRTYAIRIAPASNGVQFDEFIISRVNLHEHSFAQEWTSNDTHHWHAATCGCDVKDSYAEHSYEGDADATCDCGYTREIHTHTFDTTTWEKDDTYHWHAATCGCTDVVEDKAAHTFTYGICACGKEKVFKMTGTSIEIEAEDAILAEYNSGLTILDNESASGKKIVKMYGKYASYSGVTAADNAGNLIVKFVPEVSGTYYVYTRAIDRGALGAMVAADNDTTTVYTRTAVTNTSSAISANTLPGWSAATSFVWGTISNQDSVNPVGIEMQAGETYVIRILGTSANMAFDKFVITTDNTIPTDPVA